MEISDIETHTKEIIEQKISPFIIQNYKLLEFKQDFFNEIEKNISKFSSFPFYIQVMEIHENNKFKMFFLSSSFHSITGIKRFDFKSFDIFHNFIPKESEFNYLNIIKEIKDNEQIIAQKLFFNNPQKGKISIYTFNKLLKFSNVRILLNITFDVTDEQEKKKQNNIEKKLTQNDHTENLIDSILKNAPISIIITNKIGQILYTNPNFEKLTGYSPKEVLRKNPRILQSGLTPKKVYEEMWETITSGKSWEGSFINKKKNGEIYYENAIIFPYIDKHGKINKFIALKNDITEKKKLQQRILKTKNIENTILKLSNIGFCQINKNKIISINTKLLELTSFKKEDIISKKIEELPKSFIKIINLSQKNVLNKEYFEFETYFSELKKHFDIIAYNSKNTLILIFNDITKIKKTEESLIYRNYIQNELLEFIKVALISFDEFGKIINTNNYFNNLVKQNNSDIINKEVFCFFNEEIIKEIILKKEIENIRTKLVDSENVIHEVVVNTKHSFDNLRNNKLVIYCQIVDITKEIQEKDYLEKIVRQKTQELEVSLRKEKELNILKTDFISKTSHEFRTPLATISVASEFIKKFREKMTQEQLNLKIEKIIQQTKYMEHLLDDILLVGKFDSQKVPFDPKPTEILEFITEMIAEFKNINSEFSFNIKNNASETIVNLDDRLGRSIFQNLINNAIKYSTTKKVINIEFLNENNELIVEVQDFGLGIPSEYKDKLFTSFVRANNVAAVEGTGLGLTIVKKAVDMHKGNIFFTSEVNVGSTFWVHLPLIG